MDELDQRLLARARRAMETKGWRWADLGRALPATDQRLLNWRRRGVPGDMLPRLAEVLGVTVEWLRTGEDPKPTNPVLLEPPTALLVGRQYHAPNVAEAGATYGGKVPLISSVQAGNWREVIDNLPPGVGEDWVSTTAPVKAHTYALRVTGDSMEPEFPEGMILIVEPELEPRPGDYVIVRLDGDVTFKQLVQDAGEWLLKPLNPRYPIRPLPSGATFCGVVREANRRYR